MNKVAITACASYEAAQVRSALKEALDLIEGLDWVRPGMKIAVKANLVSMLRPEAAATTHPALLQALAQMLCEKGAQVTIGDSPGGIYTKVYLDRIYAVTGMKEIAKATDAKLNWDFSVKQAQFPQGKVNKEFAYTGWLDEADAIINFCKLKTHGMMTLSAAAKNIFGTVPGTVKPEYHYRFPEPADFADMIIDLNEYFKPCLHIIDGVVGMEGNGPTAGTPRPIGVLIASKNPHAADLLSASLIGLKPQEVPTLVAAQRRGLIPQTAEELDVCGIDWRAQIIPDYQLVKAVRSLRFNRGSEKFFGKISAAVMDRALASKPVLTPAECIGCKECFKVCPADAIEMINHKPKIDRKKCIRCFCCQEFCPKGALKVKRPLLAKILVK